MGPRDSSSERCRCARGHVVDDVVAVGAVPIYQHPTLHPFGSLCLLLWRDM